MTAIPMDTVLEALWKLEAMGQPVTLLGIGPMSGNVIRASIELAKEKDFPLFLIATRNQIDSEEFGRGYVEKWDQKDFSSYVQHICREIRFRSLMYLCRDHGGPWQRDEEKNAKLDTDTAMIKGKQSFTVDLEHGFRIIHIDPTKDPNVDISPSEVIIERTVELMEFIEDERKKRGIDWVSYEVGTEDIRGGTTEPRTFEEFIKKLLKMIDDKGLPRPAFIVGQTGTLVKMNKNVGTFNGKKASRLAHIAKKYGIGFKEHNADYLNTDVLSHHPRLGITAANVAPELGVAETKAYLELIATEKTIEAAHIQYSQLRHLLGKACLESGRWKKWLTADMQDVTAAQIEKAPDLFDEIIAISGHYVLNDPTIREAKAQLFRNLHECGVMENPERFVLKKIKECIAKYVTVFNLEGTTSRIMSAI